MAANPIAKGSIQWLGPASSGVAITPHASNEITPTRGIVCAVDGTAAARFTESSADVSLQLTAGVVYPYSIKAIRVTGTTATGLVALY
jgi:hypothetical protein